MAVYFYLLLVLCAIVSIVLTNDVNLKAEIVKQLSSGLSKYAKENEANRRKREITTSLSSSDRDNIVKTINDLRRSVGAADMPYMPWNSQLESDMITWTQQCNFDAPEYADSSGWTIRGSSPWKSNFPVNITNDFNGPTFGPPMKSVYLTQIAVAETFCNTAIIQGSLVSNVYISVKAFISESSFDQNAVQFTLGEACTRCTSGVFWCDYGLCRADCSSSIRTCFCYPYCANCATVNSGTCTCQCLNGWNGARCENQVNADATTPTCSATRTPYHYQTTAKAPVVSSSLVTIIASFLLLIAHIKSF